MYLVANNTMQLLRCCFLRRNACHVTDNTIHYVGLRAISNITTVVFDADDSLHVIMLWFSFDLITRGARCT